MVRGSRYQTKPAGCEVVYFLKSANAVGSIDEALSLGRVEPKRGEGQCGLRLFDLRRRKRKNTPETRGGWKDAVWDRQLRNCTTSCEGGVEIE